MKIVIAGAGEIGSHLARMLRAEGNSVTIVDDDTTRLNNLKATTDVYTVFGYPTSIPVLRQADAGNADLFISVYPYTTQEVNLVAALLAKQLGAAKVVGRVNDENFLTSENKLLFKEMGIELLFYPEKSAADEIVARLRHNSSAEMMEFARGKLRISQFKVQEESSMLDMKLEEFIKTINKEELQKFRIIAIRREDKTILPQNDTKFQYGDTVFAVSRKDGLEALYEHFGKENIEVKDVMIMGGSAIAAILAKNLAKENINVTIIDKDKERCIELSEQLPDNVKIICGDGRNSDVLFDEGIRDCDAFISLTKQDEINILSCVAAKKFGVQITVAEVENIEYIRLAEELGVDFTINKKLITAGRIFKFTLSERARFVRYVTGTKAEVLEYNVPRGAAITKGALKDIDFPSGAIICGIIRGNDSMIAVGSTVVEPYDRVAIFAKPETVSEIDKFFK